MAETRPPSMESSPQPDLTGRRLGDFLVLRRLGAGAMAEVYLARQVSLRRQVAVKVLKTELARDSSYVKRFHREAMAAAALAHANIVQIYEVGQIDGVHYIAQEYVAGSNLRELIERSGPPDVNLALLILRQVAAALCKAGEQGVVHRDIKPDNIMLAKTGDVKVADFGLARIQGGDGVNLTQVGVTMGTPLYMSPEQIEGKPLDSRSDIYSCGVTCYHMLSGRPPFSGETPLAVAMQHVNKLAAPLGAARPDLPDELCRIVHKMMEKRPDERYESARELLRDLRGLAIEGVEETWPEGLGGWSTGEMAAAAATPQSETTGRLDELMKTHATLEAMRPKRAWLVAAAVAFALLGVGLAALSRPASLLSGAEANGVYEHPTVWRQLYHAKMVGTEDAWQAVWRFFPEDENPDHQYAARLAKQGLIQHYLWERADRQAYEKALPLLDEMIEAGETETAFRAFGMAGKCIVLSKLGKREAAEGLRGQLTEEMRRTLDERMQRLLDEAMRGGAAGRPAGR